MEKDHQETRVYIPKVTLEVETVRAVVTLIIAVLQDGMDHSDIVARAAFATLDLAMDLIMTLVRKTNSVGLEDLTMDLMTSTVRQTSSVALEDLTTPIAAQVVTVVAVLGVHG